MRTLGLLVALATLSGADAKAARVNPDCPHENHSLRSKTNDDGKGLVEFIFKSKVEFDCFVFWIDFSGKESAPDVLGAGLSYVGKTYAGHVFRVRSYHDVLLAEETVPEGGGTVDVHACGDVDKVENALYDPSREAEYFSLAHNHSNPCYGHSANWTCARVLDYNQYVARVPSEFGFIAGENTVEEVGYQLDVSYTRQIPSIPRVSADGGPGFLIMTMPDRMRTPLLEWYDTHKHLMGHHESISGYTNNDLIKMHKLNLDFYPAMRAIIAKEMQSVMQWWCKMHLRHTSTYGVRVYHRGSMLINHVDRMETHLASAVLQVSQDVDKDGGWPLEVLLPNKMVGEVYLQPGEMVLYEGAWLRHGRPMRFKGDNFANIFTHFSPINWRGPRPYPPKTDAPLPMMFHGYMPGRCSTVADMPGKRGACTVTDQMAKWDRYHDHAKGLHGFDHHHEEDL